MLKTIARRILKNEIERKDKELKDLRDENFRLIQTQSDFSYKVLSDTRAHKQIIDNLKDEIKDLQYQNEMLRKYYHMDREPSEEEQIKMRIDMRCHDLERELDHQRNIADMAKVTLPLLSYNYGSINNQFVNMLTMTKYGGRYW